MKVVLPIEGEDENHTAREVIPTVDDWDMEHMMEMWMKCVVNGQIAMCGELTSAEIVAGVVVREVMHFHITKTTSSNF